LESELVDDAVHGAFADPKVTLAKFLSNDVGAGFRVQESVANNLTDKFLGAPVVGFGTSFGAQEGLAALLHKERPELEVTLPTEAEFSCGVANAFGAAFALDEHGELKGDFVVRSNGEGTEFTLDAFLEKLERNHRDLRKREPKLI